MNTAGRVQLALNVADLGAAVRLYTDMFGTGPSKERPGYANFAIADPPLKLVLFENPDAVSPLNHLGVELRSTADVVAVAARFADADLEQTASVVDRCCHSVQDKIWVSAPDVPLGAWEFYTVLDDAPSDTYDADSAGACCSGDSLDRCPVAAPAREPEMTEPAVEAQGVRLTYGPTVALDGVDLRVPRGSILGVLGHNGAGKTSLIRVLTTSLRPDRGRVAVDGVDVVAHPARARRNIGVTGQYAGLDDFLTTVENLQLMARLSGLRRDTPARVTTLVERFDLQAVADRRVGELSGGYRRRVDLAAGVVASPKVLFLDEPSTGLDPGARQDVWEVVAELTAAGTTVVLTTQYLEEADRLADHLVVLSGGRVVAQGAPRGAEATGRRQGRQGHRPARRPRPSSPEPAHQFAERRRTYRAHVQRHRRRSGRRSHRPTPREQRGRHGPRGRVAESR